MIVYRSCKDELHTLAGIQRAEHGEKALWFTARTPLFNPVLDDARREIIELDHPTSPRPLAVVE
jgi:hypothetical protein